jgi:hypothetical protein
MTTPATAKVEALIAGLLRLKGYRAVVLLEKPDRAVERIFLAAAPETQFAYLLAALAGETVAAASREASEILAGMPSLQELVKLEHEGFRIGRNVLSTVLRRLRAGRLDECDVHHRDLACKTLVHSLAVKSFVGRMLETHTPDVAIFNERGYTPAGEVFDGCLIAGVDVVQWCGAPQADSLIYRRYERATRDEHPLALSDLMWQRLGAMRWTADDDRAVATRIAANYASGAWYNRQQLQEGKVSLAPNEVRRRLDLDPAKKTAIIFSHILYDATFFYGDNLFEDYEHWLIESVRAAIANPNLNWVVKVHPVNVWRARMDNAEVVQIEAQTLHRHFGALPAHVKLMAADTDVNTFSLFDVADYGLTVRGTIGMELPCFGIPVVTAGTGRYDGRGFTIDPPTREKYAALLARLQEVPRLSSEEIRRARLHYYGALMLRPVPMRSFVLDFNAVRRPGMAPRADVFLTQPADERLLDTEDLGRLIRWITTSKEPELLARDIETQTHVATAEFA